jgi:hypothetical protein
VRVEARWHPDRGKTVVAFGLENLGGHKSKRNELWRAARLALKFGEPGRPKETKRPVSSRPEQWEQLMEFVREYRKEHRRDPLDKEVAPVVDRKPGTVSKWRRQLGGDGRNSRSNYLCGIKCRTNQAWTDSRSGFRWITLSYAGFDAVRKEGSRHW